MRRPRVAGALLVVLGCAVFLLIKIVISSSWGDNRYIGLGAIGVLGLFVEWTGRAILFSVSLDDGVRWRAVVTGLGSLLSVVFAGMTIASNRLEIFVDLGALVGLLTLIVFARKRTLRS